MDFKFRTGEIFGNTTASVITAFDLLCLTPFYPFPEIVEEKLIHDALEIERELGVILYGVDTVGDCNNPYCEKLKLLKILDNLSMVPTQSGEIATTRQSQVWLRAASFMAR